MTLTSHAHHIPGTPVESFSVQAFNCGGPGVCDTCSDETRWFKDRDIKRASMFPKEIEGLSPQALRKVSAKLRSQNPKPKTSMLVREYQLYRTIYALANALDGVADDSESLSNS